MTLEELWAELDRGRIYECSLRSDTWKLDGMQQGESVYIDPRPAILETLLHELLHRRYPALGERAVTKHAKVLLFKMTEADQRRWWKAYNRIKRKSRPVTLNEGDE